MECNSHDFDKASIGQFVLTVKKTSLSYVAVANSGVKAGSLLGSIQRSQANTRLDCGR